MLFNSSEFLLLFFFTFLLYWVLPRARQNHLLLVVSYIFYGWWDYRFLALILLSTVLDFVCGLFIHSEPRPQVRKAYLLASVAGNLILLGFFKYYDFFITSANQVAGLTGLQGEWSVLGILVPVGISFYTFQTMSYTIDVYRGRLTPTRSFFDFALYVSFFPQLVAGPIERAGRLLPQFDRERVADSDEFSAGLAQTALGFFKKLVIADNIALIINPVFASLSSASSAEIALAGVLFSFQIYFDFSGYSDIALGVARMIGFRLSPNFERPYLSKTPVEFWSRWHISLSTWFQEYVYMPLAMRGLRRGNSFWLKYRAHLITMVLVGLWHGAHARFLVFGLFWAFCLIAYNVFKNQFDRLPAPFAVVLTFTMACFGWFLFRIENTGQLRYLLTNLSYESRFVTFNAQLALVCGLITCFMAAEFTAHRKWVQPHTWKLTSPLVRVAYASVLILLLFALGAASQVEFVYFQF